jgi:hypothetical protein
VFLYAACYFTSHIQIPYILTSPSMHQNQRFSLYIKMWIVIYLSKMSPSFLHRPPLWPSGQSSWLQIQRSRLDSWRYQIFSYVVGLERGPLSLVSTIKELPERKSSGSGLENRDYGRAAMAARHPCIRKSLYWLARQEAFARSIEFARGLKPRS